MSGRADEWRLPLSVPTRGGTLYSRVESAVLKHYQAHVYMGGSLQLPCAQVARMAHARAQALGSDTASERCLVTKRGRAITLREFMCLTRLSKRTRQQILALLPTKTTFRYTKHRPILRGKPHDGKAEQDARGGYSITLCARHKNNLELIAHEVAHVLTFDEQEDHGVRWVNAAYRLGALSRMGRAMRLLGMGYSLHTLPDRLAARAIRYGVRSQDRARVMERQESQ